MWNVTVIFTTLGKTAHARKLPGSLLPDWLTVGVHVPTLWCRKGLRFEVFWADIWLVKEMDWLGLKLGLGSRLGSGLGLGLGLGSGLGHTAIRTNTTLDSMDRFWYQTHVSNLANSRSSFEAPHPIYATVLVETQIRNWWAFLFIRIVSRQEPGMWWASHSQTTTTSTTR